MKNAMKRFKEFFFYAPVRWYKLPNPDVRVPRYPSPASEPIDHFINRDDYKTAYKDSQHHIRYLRFEAENPQDKFFYADPFGETVEQKLVRYKVLSSKDTSNTEAVEKAKQAYLELTGESADRRVYVDDLKISQHIKFGVDNRESIAHGVRNLFTRVRDHNKSEPLTNDLNETYNQNNLELTRLDWLADDPVFRQLKLDLEWILEEETKLREESNYLAVFQGDSRFWQAIDNSHDSHNIQAVQSAIGDRISDLSETTLAQEHNTEQYHLYTKLEYPIKTIYEN